jgi:hypothetical protein
MNKQAIRWAIAWAALAATILVVSFFRGHFELDQVASLLIFFAGAIVLVLVRPVMKRFPPKRRITVNRGPTTRIQKYLLPVGVIALFAAFAWIMTLARMVPNTQTGVAVLFFPSIGFLVLAVAAIAFRVYIWFFGD